MTPSNIPSNTHTRTSARILADSKAWNGERLTTMELVFPRFILAEMNTHRAFSRNSASSRAVPVLRLTNKVMDDPFIPQAWGSNRRGMQAGPEVENPVLMERFWEYAARDAVQHARDLLGWNVHKQLANRILEPFLWHTAIFTGTKDAWNSFFHLRCHWAAQPEMAELAFLAAEAYLDGFPIYRDKGEWHLPLVDAEERSRWQGRTLKSGTPVLAAVSAARCARVSYLTHDGRKSLLADLRLYRRLRNPRYPQRPSEDEPQHLSPLEHPAVCLHHRMDTDSNFGKSVWMQHRKQLHWHGTRIPEFRRDDLKRRREEFSRLAGGS